MVNNLTTYRALAAVLAASTLGAAWMVRNLLDDNERLTARLERARRPAPAPAPPPRREPGAQPDVTVLRVGEQFAEIERRDAAQSDVSQSYFGDDAATVHMHVMGFSQTCPLHIHRRTEEVTIVVAGVAEVTHVHGAAGRLVSRSGRFTAGALVRSPTFCGHEFRNPSGDHMLGNLVIAAPPFDGNFYLRPDDPRMLQGSEPFTLDLPAAHERFARGAAPTERAVLPILQGRLSSLLLRGEVPLPNDPAHPALVYVVAGAGSLRLDRDTPVRATDLVVVRSRHAATLRSADGATLAAYVFTPRGAPGP